MAEAPWIPGPALAAVTIKPAFCTVGRLALATLLLTAADIPATVAPSFYLIYY